MDDTHPKIQAMLIDGYRRMTPRQKLERVGELNDLAREFAAARIRREHPGIGERELRLRLASLWLDAATMRRAFGWDPDVEGR